VCVCVCVCEWACGVGGAAWRGAVHHDRPCARIIVYDINAHGNAVFLQAV